MKIAMIAPYPIFPPDEGGRVRAYHLLKHLAAAGHEMLLLCPSGGSSPGLPVRMFETTAPGRRKQMLDPGFMRRAWKILEAERPDIVLSECVWPAMHGAYLARRLGVPLVIDAQNVEGARFRSAGSRVWPFVQMYERLALPRAASVLVVSDEDRARFQQRGVNPAKIQLVPNGVDPEHVHPDPAAGAAVRRELAIADHTRLLLFFGQLGYAPNAQALCTIHEELLPRLDRSGEDYAFVVVGKNHEQASARYTHPRLRYVGSVPAMAPYINAADVVAVPITSGGGTRLKILESIATATPVISTTLGAEGIDRSACGDLLTIGDGWDAFAAALLSRGDGRTVVKGSNVPASFLDMYSWANIVSRIEWPRRRS